MFPGIVNCFFVHLRSVLGWLSMSQPMLPLKQFPAAVQEIIQPRHQVYWIIDILLLWRVREKTRIGTDHSTADRELAQMWRHGQQKPEVCPLSSSSVFSHCLVIITGVEVCF